MKKIIVITFLLLFSSNTFAQKHEIGAFLGGANAIADIGKTDWVNPFPRELVKDNKIPFSLGILYRYNLNPQQSLRFSFFYASIGDHNKNAEEVYRRNREDWYVNKIIELSSVFEYNFFPINAEQEYAHSPYIFGGLGLFGTDKYTYRIKKNKEEETFESRMNTAFSASIPFGLGYKYKFNWNWIIGVEVGFRATFVDYIERWGVEDKDFQFSGEYYKISKDISKDEIDRRKKEAIEGYKNLIEIGDSRKNDWYVFTGLTLTYTFGRPACFCD